MEAEKTFVLNQMWIALNAAIYATSNILEGKGIEENEKILELAQNEINDLLRRYFKKKEA